MLMTIIKTRNTTFNHYILVLFFFSLLPFKKIVSQGFQVNLQGQKQQGMGSAGTGLITDGAGLFYNPGTVVFLDESSINAACTPTFANTSYLDLETQQ
ncbi:MAG: hypothetical protein CL824_03545, partial [Crocinitomicaceae bacterium]|nr:hypothetical protein [Crocinitomicaceae bacterium]